jgi:hypothetical protein
MPANAPLCHAWSLFLPSWPIRLTYVHRSVVHSITNRRPGFGVCHLRWHAPRNPPDALRAPRWYFAETPATHRAQGPVRGR